MSSGGSPLSQRQQQRSSPATVSGGFDGSTFYDPDFTVEISNRMRVPDKISVLNGEEEDRLNQQPDQRDRLTLHSKGKGSNDWMRVPERILVAGNDRHVAGITPLPELRLESSIRGEDRADLMSNAMQMMTPPRTLSLNEHSYPTIREAGEQEEEDGPTAAKKRISNSGKQQPVWSMNGESPADLYGSGGGGGNNYNNSMDMTMSGGGDVNLVRRQLKLMNRRLTMLEQENRNRYQRELILYSLGILYFVMKGVNWFNRRPF